MKNRMLFPSLLNLGNSKSEDMMIKWGETQTVYEANDKGKKLAKTRFQMTGQCVGWVIFFVQSFR